MRGGDYSIKLRSGSNSAASNVTLTVRKKAMQLLVLVSSYVERCQSAWLRFTQRRTAADGPPDLPHTRSARMARTCKWNICHAYRLLVKWHFPRIVRNTKAQVERTSLRPASVLAWNGSKGVFATHTNEASACTLRGGLPCLRRISRNAL